MKKNVTKAVCLGLFLFTSMIAKSQAYQDSLRKDDDDIISSIAPYPADVREAILNVSQYPQKIVKLERIQARTSQSFQDMVSSYPHEEQLKYYELSRYPDLVHELVDGPPKTLEQVKPSLSSYPKEVVDAVSALYPMHLADLTSMDKTYQSSQKALAKVIEDLPSSVQADFNKIVAKPEVMNLLTDRIDLVVSLGETYKNDPRGTKEKLDSLSEQIEAQNQKDLEDYKQQVASDPKMQEEMKKSAEDFASTGDPNESLDEPQQQAQTQPTVVNNYYSSNYAATPYPYWFGYPSWYSYPMWYPAPLYYYTGFYLGAGGNVVVVGLPSRTYSSWFFSFGYRRYPRYYNYCNNYYVAHRSFVNHINVYRGFHTSVNNHFTRVNRSTISREANVNRRQGFTENRRPSLSTTENRRPSSSSTGGTRPYSFNRNTTAPVRTRSAAPEQFRNSINQPTNFNRQSFNNFHSNQFHQQSWGGVRGGSFGGARTGGGSVGGGGGHGRR
ncbi:MAG TPA: hypothetical protein VL728_08235 [Cyclobacteriaceae bacterium]|nr:hypothetical protein [Cyclobacteriaceae bacterium]